MQKCRDYVVLFINGQRHLIQGAQAFMMLANFLRYELKLTGTKIVCAEGDCGACTVLVHRPMATNPDDAAFVPINACIVTMAQLDGSHILTVEAMKENGQLSAVQEAIVKAHGSQCGFCTPGFTMAITALFQKPRTNVTAQTVKNCLTGNLCRCTGYQPLIEAALAVEQCKQTFLKERFLSEAVQKERKESPRTPIHFADGQIEFIAPRSLSEVEQWLKKRPDCQIIAGATDLGVLQNKGKSQLQLVLSLHLVQELYGLQVEGDRIKVGACVTLSELRRFCKGRVPQIATFINVFASPQIKNMATLVGNIANGSPIGDTLPFLMVTKGQVHTRSHQGTRMIALEDLYSGYKSLTLLPGEFITHASFNIPHTSHVLRLDKVSQRKDLDIATVNSAFYLILDEKLSTLKEVRLAVGGVGAVVMRLKKTEAFLAGQVLSRSIVDMASELIQQEIAPMSDLRGTDAFRRVLADGLFRRFCDEMMGEQ